VEAVVDVGVEMRGVVLAVRLQRRLVVRPSLVDPLVEPGVVQQQRGLDLRHVRGCRLTAVERHRGREVRQPDGHGVADPAAVAEADRADLAVRFRVAFESPERRDEIFCQLALVERPLHRLAFVVGARIAAQRGQPVRCQRGEAGDGDAPRDILDIGVEAAVLVDHHDTAAPAAARGMDEIAADSPMAPRRIIRDPLSLDARVALVDLFGERVFRRQGLQQRRGGDPADGEFRRPVEKLPALDQPVRVSVVEIQQFLVEVGRLLAFHDMSSRSRN
jgi:hypothetical protein